jgi:predicted ATPase
MDEANDRGTSRLFVMTGALGAGKTELLRHLGDDVSVVEELARAILAEQRASEGRGTWDQDSALFVRLMLDRAVDDHRRATAVAGTTVLDRGIPDCIVYAMRAGVDPGDAIEASGTYRYENDVLFLEPWEEIYTPDDDRTLDFHGAAEFGEAIHEAYARLGYTLISVPSGSISDRVAFVRRTIRVDD